MEGDTLEYDDVHAALIDSPSASVRTHLQRALRAEDAATKNYHVRTALQALVVEADDGHE